MKQLPQPMGDHYGGLMDYELSTLGDSIYMNVPMYNFHGTVTHSPNGRYFVSGRNHMLVVIDTEHEQLMYVYDVFHRIEDSSVLVTDHPYIAVIDIVGLGAKKQNDIYILNHRSDILFKVTVHAHVHKIVLSENAEFIAIQLTSNMINLYDVETCEQIATWKTPKVVAITLKIDKDNRSVLMSDYKGYVYTYNF
jgi:hypothetical protein